MTPFHLRSKGRGTQPPVIVNIPEESMSVGGEFDDKIFSSLKMKTDQASRENSS